jgi:hypothetical protein
MENVYYKLFQILDNIIEIVENITNLLTNNKTFILVYNNVSYYSWNLYAYYHNIILEPEVYPFFESNYLIKKDYESSSSNNEDAIHYSNNVPFIGTLAKYYRPSYNTLELRYKRLFKFINNSSFDQNTYDSIFLESVHKFKLNKDINKTLFMAKYIFNDKFQTQCKIMKRSYIDDDNKYNFNDQICYLNCMEKHAYYSSKNKIGFLSIEYSHPKLGYQLGINLDSSYYVQNNDILDSIFIANYLRKNYKEDSFILDDNYKINIIDQNANIFQLQNNEYIHFKNHEEWCIIKN